MARRAVREQKDSINPVFFIPDGVEELEYSDRSVTVSADEIDENEFDIDIDVDTSDSSESPDSDADELEVPQILSVISQSMRMDSSGKEVVDVVFDVTAVSGVTSYEMRVVKL
jgi:hypothetical protein